MLLQAYIRDTDVHPLFTLMMMAIWFVSNMICIFIMEKASDKDEEEIDSYSTTDSNSNSISSFIVPKLKYLAIVYVNYFLIVPIIERGIEGESISNGAYVVLFIYNLFCLCFIMKTRKSKDREFYSFIMIVLPVIIVLAIDLIITYR